MPAWVIPAVTAAAGLIGGAIAKGKDTRQINQQRKLNLLQEESNMRMMDYSMGLQKNMWEATGPVGQMEQMKKAGVNPALMYGGGGAGGATLGSPSGSVGGAQAPGGSGREAEELMSMGLQIQSAMQLQEAQKKNIEADTKGKEIDNMNKAPEGIGGQLVQAQTKDYIQGVENKRSQKALLDVQTNIAKLDETLKHETLKDMGDTIHWEAEQAKFKMSILDRDDQLSRATLNSKIDQVAADLTGTYLRNALTKAQTGKVASDIKVNEQQIQKMIDDVKIGYQKNTIDETRNQIIKDLGDRGLDLETGKAIANTVTNVIGMFKKNPIGTATDVFDTFTGEHKYTETRKIFK